MQKGKYTLWWLINKFNIPKDTIDKDDRYSHNNLNLQKSLAESKKQKPIYDIDMHKSIFLGLLTNLLNKTHSGKKESLVISWGHKIT